MFHEPLGEPFYYGPERMSPRFTAENRPEDFQKYKDLTFKKMWDEIVAPNTEGKPRTFVKDMAQYIIPPVTSASTTPELPDKANDGNPTVIPTEALLSPDVEHAFLIRTPEKAVPSYYRLCVPPKSEVTGFDYFEPEEVGVRESKMLYDWFVEKGKKPIIVDAATLLSDPAPTMERFCNSCGIDFTSEMCSWEGGAQQEHFKKWVGFHDDAEKSNGIAKPAGSEEEIKAREEKKAKEVEQMPQIVKDAIRNNMAEYEYLRAYSTAGTS